MLCVLAASSIPATDDRDLWFLEAAAATLARAPLLNQILTDSGAPNHEDLDLTNPNLVCNDHALYPAYESLIIVLAKSVMCGPYEEYLKAVKPILQNSLSKKKAKAAARLEANDQMGAANFTAKALYTLYHADLVAVEEVKLSESDDTSQPEILSWMRNAFSHGQVQLLGNSKVRMEAWRQDPIKHHVQQFLLEIHIHGLYKVAQHCFAHFSKDQMPVLS